MGLPASVDVVDSHTEGEPTRVIVGGWGQVAGATMAERREQLRRRHDELRRAVVCEPRGHGAMVGALLTPPVERGSQAGVVFFDNGGYLGMCGHGLIGVVRTLAFLGRLPEVRDSAAAAAQIVRIDTPAGTVEAQASGADCAAAAGEETDGAITVVNVPARCQARDVAVDVPGLGRILGDVAYGGNWFFIVRIESLAGMAFSLHHLGALTDFTSRIRAALGTAGIRGEAGAEIDHVEIVGPPSGPHADSRNFVLCPGGAYDRSPCGTGTSAMLAALHERGQLALGRPWRQEGIAGGLFTAWLTREGDSLVPHIRGRAYITGRATLIFERHDPFREGFPEP
jgi:4-hydroxyproline epimerase